MSFPVLCTSVWSHDWMKLLPVIVCFYFFSSSRVSRLASLAELELEQEDLIPVYCCRNLMCAGYWLQQVIDYSWSLWVLSPRQKIKRQKNFKNFMAVIKTSTLVLFYIFLIVSRSDAQSQTNNLLVRLWILSPSVCVSQLRADWFLLKILKNTSHIYSIIAL